MGWRIRWRWWGRGGDGSYSFGLASGALPAGLSLSGDGTLSGTPLETGSFAFEVAVTDGQSNSGQQAYALQVDPVSGGLSIAPAVLAEGRFGVAYSEALSASGGSGGYVFSVSAGALPTGISLAAGGALAGIPTETGDFAITVAVLDDQGNSGAQAYVLRIDAVDGVIVITPDSLPDGDFGVSYSQALSASGGSGGYVYSIGAGSLPTGLSLSADGVISGTPSQTGAFSPRIDVVDDQGNSGAQTYLFAIAPITGLSITPASLTDATYGVAYAVTLSGVGGDGSYLFELASGALPAGLSLALDGTLTGTPAATGSFAFEVALRDGQGNSGQQAYVLQVDPVIGGLTVLPDEVKDGVYGQGYRQVLIAVGNETALAAEISTTFSRISGTLPAGLTLLPGGFIVGEPQDTGDFTLGVRATDEFGNTGDQDYSFSVLPVTGLVQISPDTLPAGEFGVSFDQQLSAVGGAGPYTYLLAGGSLPDGLGMTAQGLISGSPTQTGNFNFAVTAMDSLGNSGSILYALRIDAIDGLLTVAPAALPQGAFDVPYNTIISATGGDGAYAFSLGAGLLPEGIVLSSGGVLQGLPQQTGDFAITINVVDSNGNTGARDYTLVIQAIDGLIVITPDVLPEGVFGTAYNVSITATGGSGLYLAKLTGGVLPKGLLFVPETGSIIGTPTETGSFPIRVEVVDPQGNTGSIDYVLTINPAEGVLTIAPDSLASGKWNTSYFQQLEASGGDGSYVFSEPVSSNGARALPDGIDLRPDGQVVGTPVVVGTFAFPVLVTDGQGNTGSKDYTIVIEPVTGAIEITPDALPDGTYGDGYSVVLVASGGAGSYQFTLSSGALPTGLSLAASGALSGVPQETGDFGVTIVVQDSQGNTGSMDYDFTIEAVENIISLSPDTLPNGIFGLSYNVVIGASGGTGIYSGEITAGSLPDGIVLVFSNGVITGVPSETGDFPFQLTVTDSAGNTGQIGYVLTVTPVSGLLIIAPELLPRGNMDRAYEVQLETTGGSGGFAYALDDGALPLGLELSGDGRIFGVPVEYGSYNFRVAVRDNQANSGSINYALQIFNGRPNPAEDPDVIDLINAQFDNSERHARAVSSSVFRRHEDLHERMKCADPMLQCEGFGYWQEGSYVGDSDYGYANIVVGIDNVVHENLALGVAAGYGQWNEVIGSFGSRTEGESLLYSGYFAWRMPSGLFLDGVAGRGDVSFTDRRYVTRRDSVEYSQREGDIDFAGLKLSGEIPYRDNMRILPHLRYDYSHVALAATQEGGATNHALGFGKSSRSRNSLSMGATALIDSPRSWGLLRTKLRAEIGHEAHSGYRQSIYYLDRPGERFTLSQDSSSSTRATVSVGFEITGANSDFEFEVFVSGSDAESEPTLGVMLGANFWF